MDISEDLKFSVAAAPIVVYSPESTKERTVLPKPIMKFDVEPPQRP